MENSDKQENKTGKVYSIVPRKVSKKKQQKKK